MMLKLKFPLGLRQFIDILKVQLPAEGFIEPLSDILCNPLYFQVSKELLRGAKLFLS